jgi:site-specific recombinase XerD
LNYWELRTDTSKATPAFIRYDKNVGKRIARISTATIRQIVAHYTAIAGIEKGRFTPHSFRHSFALNMLRNTGNLAIVQDLLGHRSPQATRIYTTISNDELKKAHKQAYG